MLLKYLGCLFRCHLDVCNLFLARFNDFHDGLILAQTHTTGLGYHNVLHALLLNQIRKSGQNRSCTGCNAAGSHTNYNAGSGGVLVSQVYLILHLVINLYIPDLIVSYAPVALLVILIGMIVLGFVNAVLGLILTIVNPVIGGIYTFFFSNLIGKQITKAVFTSAILCAVVYCLEYFGFLVIAISADSLAAYIPLALVSLFLWFFIGFFL